MTTIRGLDLGRLAAYDALLALPDPIDLPARRSLVTCAGDPDRRVTRLPPIFMAWLQRRCLAIDPEDAVAPAKTDRRARLRMVQMGERRVRMTRG
jgi:hypothetical protein